MTVSATEHYKAGRLREAIEAQSDEVKRHPADSNLRAFLAELLLVAGEIDRADTHLDAIGKQDMKAALGIALIRQLVRGEQARRQFYTEGRVPAFLDQPSPQLQLHLEASIRLREKDALGAQRLLEDAEAGRGELPGKCNGAAFEDMRDIDDLTSSFFEVLTSTGKYYWIPMARVELVEFSAPERPRDLLWRRAHMVVSGGPDGEVFLPAIYSAGDGALEDSFRLGRATEWVGGEAAPVRGIGQRSFLIGEDSVPIMDIKTLEFAGSVG
ncbi:MAG TPA: type VI secretion system accessory protein TagJ [Alphaproteobacteria bacterium]|nr:type VI secretion system accessory protein TagJ [Alphaproteobacteria bacterium]